MGPSGTQIRFQRVPTEPASCGINEPPSLSSPIQEITQALRRNVDLFPIFPSQPITSFADGVVRIGRDSAMITRTVDGKPFAELSVDETDAELLFHFNHTYEDHIAERTRTIVGSLVYTLTPDGMIVPARVEIGGSNSTGTVLLPEEWCVGILCLNWQSNTPDRSREQVLELLTTMFLSEEDESSTTAWSREWRSEIYTWVHENRDLLQESMRTRYSHMQLNVNNVFRNYMNALINSSHQFCIKDMFVSEGERKCDVYHPTGKLSTAYSFTVCERGGLTTYLFNGGASYIYLDENEPRLQAGVRTGEGSDLWNLSADSSTVHLQMNFPQIALGTGNGEIRLQLQLLRNGRIIPTLQLDNKGNGDNWETIDIPPGVLEILGCIGSTALKPEELLEELLTGFFPHGEEVDLRRFPHISPHTLYTKIFDWFLDDPERITSTPSQQSAIIG